MCQPTNDQNGLWLILCWQINQLLTRWFELSREAQPKQTRSPTPEWVKTTDSITTNTLRGAEPRRRLLPPLCSTTWPGCGPTRPHSHTDWSLQQPEGRSDSAHLKDPSAVPQRWRHRPAVLFDDVVISLLRPFWSSSHHKLTVSRTAGLKWVFIYILRLIWKV